jgi:hypothetical protein
VPLRVERRGLSAEGWALRVLSRELTALRPVAVSAERHGGSRGRLQG